VDAALSFDVPQDPESVELQHLLKTLPAAEATERITGLTPADPLVRRRAGGKVARQGRRGELTPTVPPEPTAWPC
jgi:hypothetical protein